MVVDLSALDVATRSLFTELVLLRRRLDVLQGRVVLEGLGELLRQVFVRTRIGTLFETYDTASETLQFLRLETPCGKNDSDHFGQATRHKSHWTRQTST